MIVSHLALVVECVFLGAVDRVLKHVVHTSKAGRLALCEQLLAAARDQHRSHVGLGLRQVEELATVGRVAHFDDSLTWAVMDVRERARRDIDVWIAPLLGSDNDAVGQPHDAAHCLLVAR